MKLREAFEGRWRRRPACAVTAPGRVNIIGEHTDYNGYPVLPIAIEKSISVVAAPNEKPVFEFVNLNQRFDPRIFSWETIMQRYDQGDWGNYLKAAVRGLYDAGICKRDRVRGINAVVEGTIPPSSGLSSSSALIVACALCICHANDVEPDRTVLAEVLAKAERYAGIEGGGMDQAISLLGQKDHALLIDFFPLRTQAIPVPEGWDFVVCDSLVQASKTAWSRTLYNQRVIECRLACAVMEKAITIETGMDVHIQRLSDVTPERLGMPWNRFVAFAQMHLGLHGWMIDELSVKLNRTLDEILHRYCTLTDGSIFPQPSDGFHLYRRFSHVVHEAKRVYASVSALEEGNMRNLGLLMDESHRSCRDLYGVSSIELEELVSFGKMHDSYGSRLTGAGFGGCTIHLLPEERSDAFMKEMKSEYYTDERIATFEERTGRTFNFDDAVFKCRPIQGACLSSFHSSSELLSDNTLSR